MSTLGFLTDDHLDTFLTLNQRPNTKDVIKLIGKEMEVYVHPKY